MKKTDKSYKSRINTIDTILEKTETFCSATFICICVILVFISAISRSFGKPMNWAQDISLLFFAWSVFLGADVAFRKDKLVKVELLVERLPKKISSFLTVISYLIIICFLVFSIYYGVKLTIKTRSRVFQGVSFLSYSWVTASYPFGSFLLLNTAIKKTIRNLREM